MPYMHTLKIPCALINVYACYITLGTVLFFLLSLLIFLLIILASTEYIILTECK